MSLTFNAVNLSCVRQQKKLFDELSLRLSPGELIIVEGNNGSGKSSLLRLLTGLATPMRGEIYWCDQPIKQVATDFHQALHYVGHTNGLKLGLTVNENLRVANYLSLNESTENLSQVLHELRLTDYLHTPTRYLSAGQKRRVALAKLFLQPKPLWILDEPLTALDAQTQQYFISQLEKHLQNDGMVIMTSHHALKVTVPRVQQLRLDQHYV